MAYKPPPGISTPPDELAPTSGYPPPHRYLPLRPPFDYSRLIKDSLRLVWRHKFLWFFGLFAYGSATTLSWPGAPGNFSFGDGNGAPDTAEVVQEFSDWAGDHLTLIIGALVAAGVLGFLAWLWSLVCRGAVISSVKDIGEGSPAGFRIAFARGRQSFVRLLLFDLFLVALLIGFTVIAAAVVSLLVFLAVSFGAAGETIVIVILSLVALWLLGIMAMTLGYLTCFTIWFVWWVPVSLLVIYATRAVVLERKYPARALGRAWRLMVKTVTRTLLLFLLSTGLGIAGGIGSFMVTALAAVPAIVAWLITGTGGWPIAGIAVSIALSLLPVAALVLTAALFNTYFTSFWTIAYLRLTGQETKTEESLQSPDAILSS